MRSFHPVWRAIALGLAASLMMYFLLYLLFQWDLDKEFLSVFGNWFSGLGAFGAIAAALYIGHVQTHENKLQDAVRCLHHAMAVTDDLRARVCYLRKIVTEGKRPLIAITVSATAISRRYEALFERDLYRHIPGPIVNMITAMAGSFFGIEMLGAGVAAAMDNPLDIEVPAAPLNEEPATSLKKLEDELLSLWEALEYERKKLG